MFHEVMSDCHGRQEEPLLVTQKSPDRVGGLNLEMLTGYTRVDSPAAVL